MRLIFLIIAVVVAGCGPGTYDGNPPEWWEVDPTSPPEDFEPYGYDRDCRDDDYEHFDADAKVSDAIAFEASRPRMVCATTFSF